MPVPGFRQEGILRINMIKKLLAAFILILITNAISSGCSSVISDNLETDYLRSAEGLDIFSGDLYLGDNEQLKNMSLVKETHRYALFIDEKTTEVAVLSKTDNYVYLSNPFRNKEDIPGKEYIYRTCSSLNIEFFNIQGVRFEYNSFSDSVEYEQVEIYNKGDDEGIRIIYTIGKDMGREIYPPVFTVEKFDEIYEKLSSFDSQSLKESYILVFSDDKDSQTYKRYIEDYPALVNQDLYIRRDLNTRQKNLLLQALESIEFSFEDMIAEMEKAEYENNINSVVFQIPLDLNLTEDGLIAEVDSSLIISPQGIYLHKLTIFNGFNGITPDKNEGFIFVPDGSGSVLDAQAKDLTSTYNSIMYNKDQALSNEQVIIKTAQQVMPVFGIGSGKNTLIAIIEEGTALSTISARQLSRQNLLAYVSNSFIYFERDYRDYSGKLRIGQGIIFPKDPAESKFRIKYGFISSESASYNDIAKYFREYLIKNGILQKIENPGYPLTVEFLGNIKKRTTFAGIPIEIDVALTTFNEAVEITRSLTESGIDDILVTYNGIFNNGINNSAFNKITIEKPLGSSDDFKRMVEYFKRNSIDFYPRMEIIYAFQNKGFSGFNIKSDAVRRLDMTIAKFSDINLATNKEGNKNSRFIVSQDKLPGMIKNAINTLAVTNDISAVSLGSMGTYINSNYKKNNIISRDKAIEYYRESMEHVMQSNMKLMVDTGNFYTWEYTDNIISLPSGSSGHKVEMYPVPVLQMVLHGYIRYTGIPMNESSDLRLDLLRILETGSGVYIKLMNEDNVVFKDTSHENLFSISYSGWKEILPGYYKEAFEVLNDLAGEEIIRHTKIAEGVYCTSFSGGSEIYVNYNETKVKIGDIEIDSVGYYVLSGVLS